MRSRPWPIVILAAAYVLAPLANVLYGSWMMHRPLHLYFFYMFAHGHWQRNAAHFIGSPIAGVSVYKTRKWSYPVFIAMMLWIFYSDFLTWQRFPHQYDLTSLIANLILNIAIVTYFLVPEIRNVYFNPRARWWESKPRYDISFPVRIRCGEASSEGVAQNISEGGLYVRSEQILLSDGEVDLAFEAHGKPYVVRAKVVHARRAPPTGYGFQFIHTPETKSAIKALIKNVKGAGARERIGSLSLKDELVNWFKARLKRPV